MRLRDGIRRRKRIMRRRDKAGWKGLSDNYSAELLRHVPRP
jgi:hypothetical protein